MKRMPVTQTFSSSICAKVHGGLHARTKGNALAILARAQPCTGFELTEEERIELTYIVSPANSTPSRTYRTS